MRQTIYCKYCQNRFWSKLFKTVLQSISGRLPEKGRKRGRERKMSKQPPPALIASAIGPSPTLIQISRTPRHWKFTQYHHATRPLPLLLVNKLLIFQKYLMQKHCHFLLKKYEELLQCCAKAPHIFSAKILGHLILYILDDLTNPSLQTLTMK